MSAKRERRVIVIAGQKRSGKTTLLIELVRQALARGAKGHTTIFEIKGELGGTLPEDLDAAIETIVEQNERAIAARQPAPTQLLVLDDGDAFLPKVARGAWIRLYLQSAQLDMDVIVTCKRLQNLSPSLLNGADFIYAFRLPRSDKTGRERISEVLPNGEDDLPVLPFRFVQVDPNGDEAYFGEIQLRQDGRAAIIYDGEARAVSPTGTE